MARQEPVLVAIRTIPGMWGAGGMQGQGEMQEQGGWGVTTMRLEAAESTAALKI